LCEGAREERFLLSNTDISKKPSIYKRKHHDYPWKKLATEAKQLRLTYGGFSVVDFFCLEEYDNHHSHGKEIMEMEST
jgi:hypothetical protein